MTQSIRHVLELRTLSEETVDGTRKFVGGTLLRWGR